MSNFLRELLSKETTAPSAPPDDSISDVLQEIETATIRQFENDLPENSLQSRVSSFYDRQSSIATVGRSSATPGTSIFDSCYNQQTEPPAPSIVLNNVQVGILKIANIQRQNIRKKQQELDQMQNELANTMRALLDSFNTDSQLNL
jgi:hypothetical protein